MFGKRNARLQEESGRQRAVTGIDNDMDTMSTTSRLGSYLFSAALFAGGFCAVLAASWSERGVLWTLVALFAGLLLASAIRTAYEWERIQIVRFGRLNRLAGPGLFLKIPLIESEAARIDMRVRATTFYAEETLSSDIVPVDVDCVLFWMVWDPQKACTEVRNYEKATVMAAQTAMRDVIGQVSLSELAVRRSFLDRELQQRIGKRVEDWGISVIAVEIRDIVVPRDLQQTMAVQAQAERLGEARMRLAEVERDIADLYLEAAATYGQPEAALSLRTMNLVYDGMQSAEGSLVVPSAYAEGFTDTAKAASAPQS